MPPKTTTISTTTKTKALIDRRTRAGSSGSAMPSPSTAPGSTSPRK
jgi:hypothetical protein